MLERANALLKELGDKIGISDLYLDDDAYCRISFEEGPTVLLRYEEDINSMVLFGEIAGELELEEHHRLALYEELLAANLFWQDTGGGTIGLERYSKTLFLAQKFPIEGMVVEDIEDALEDFANQLDLWIEAIDHLLRETPVEASESAEATPEAPSDNWLSV